VSGELERTVGGPSTADAKSPRRSLYQVQRRGSMPAFQPLFDGPDAVLESCGRRHVSTVPLQALYLLNNEFAAERAKAFARRVYAEAGDDRERQVATAFALALGRPPADAERAAAQRLFQAHAAGAEPGRGPPQDLVHFCQALQNVNEFVYLE